MLTAPVRVVLVRPLIPPNVGSVGRTCVGMNLPLWIVGPLAIDLHENKLKRAGLDYWPNLDLTLQPDEDAAVEALDPLQPVLFSSRGADLAWDVNLQHCGALIFGSETTGLEEKWYSHGWRTARFPFSNLVRCYNLSNTVSAAVMEWARQSRWQPGTDLPDRRVLSEPESTPENGGDR